MSLVKLNSKIQEKASSSSSIHLEDIPENNPLYAQLQEFITQKQSNTFAAIAKEDTIDDMKTYEKVEKREMIFLLKNSDIQRREEPWKIFQRYLLNGLYFPGESYKTRKYYETLLISTGVEFQHFSGYNTGENVYNFSKMIVKQVIHIEDWGISSMTESEMTQKVLKNVLRKLPETCLAISKKSISFFENPTSYSYLGGQIEWEMGLTQILEQPYQNPKFPSEAFFEVYFGGSYLLAHK